MTYQQWLADAAQALNQVNPTENGKVDALVLLQHATGKSRTQILAFDETEIDEKVRLKLTALLHSRDNMPSRQHFLVHHLVWDNNSYEYQPH